MKNLTRWMLAVGTIAAIMTQLPADAIRHPRQFNNSPAREGARPFRPLLPVRHASNVMQSKGFVTPPENPARKASPSRAARRVPARAGAPAPDLKLRGSMVSTWSFINFPGLYYVPSTPDGVFEQIPGASIIAEYGAWDDGNGHYYVGGVEDYGIMTFPLLNVYSTDTWDQLDGVADCDHSILCTDNATDPTTQDVYGCFYYYDEEDNPHLAWAKADYPAGKSDAIRVLSEEEHMYGVACDASGQYYGILSNGNLVKVDKSTGVFSIVGDTGLRPYYGTSATFDDKSGNIIFSYAPATGNCSLWCIDPATAAATLLVEYVENDQITALEVIKPEAEDLAPAAPLISAETPEGGMEMNYTITMPSTLFNGNPGSGELKWALDVDGVRAAEGTSQFGAEVEGSYTLASQGVHNLIVYVENSVGKSPRTKLQVINGSGIPKAPTGLGINNFGDGSIGLYWDAVTESADGAYVDPKGITYMVIRNGEIIAHGLTDTWYDDMVTVPDSFLKLNYEVKAEYATSLSDPATVSTGVGANIPPYHSVFTGNVKDNDQYTVINSNGDTGAWWFSPSYGSFIYDYSSENAADDWLISPAFHLEAGKTYELSYSVAGNSVLYTERYAVAMGVAPVAASMITQLLPPTEICTERYEPQLMTLKIEPASTGNYYFGWHALSDAGMFQIHLRDISLSAPLTAGSPAEVTDLKLVRDLEGHLKLHGSFKAPVNDINGLTLTSISSITVNRDDRSEPVASLSAVNPGATVEFDDTDIPAAGTYTYRVICSGTDGQLGREISASVYVGPVAPENVPYVDIKESPDNPGTVTISWEAPEKDIEGNTINPANLTYMVYVPGSYGMAEPILEEPVASRSMTLKVCDPNQMDFAVFFISAFNLGLESAGVTRSDMIPVGKAESLPYRHSFTSADLESHLIGYIAPAGTYGSLAVGNLATNGVAAADGDDAYMTASQSEAGQSIDIFTGKIDLGSAARPTLYLQHYVWSNADCNSFTVQAETSAGQIIEIGSADHTYAASEGWQLLMCPLDNVKGEVVKITISAQFNSHDTMLFDALRIADRHDCDIAAMALGTPARVIPTQPFGVMGTVANLGAKAAEGFDISLLLNGEKVAGQTGGSILPGESLRIYFPQTLSPITSGKLDYTLKVTAAGDGDASNDMSPVASPMLVESKLPAVNDLSASNEENGVKLTWTEPSTEGNDLKETEDFESAEAWTEEVDGWTMVDVDSQQIGTLDGAGFPDPVAMRTYHSFFVFDNASDDIFFYNPALSYVLKGNSGSKSIVTMYILNNNVAQDDWAISPLLSGEQQTISFYARSFHPEYPDHLEVLYSMKDSTDPADFVTLCEDGPFEVPQLVDAVGDAAYTRYEFNLPAGARRFALRAYNEPGTGFMLMIDDVNFRQANASLAIDHYDIYRDGLCINDSPVTTAGYTDRSPAGGKHVYNVIVAYNRGLSPASNSVEITTSGIDAILGGNIRVAVEGHEIVVSGISADTAVSLSSADGRLVYTGRGQCRIPADKGVYLLTLGRNALKVMVK